MSGTGGFESFSSSDSSINVDATDVGKKNLKYSMVLKELDTRLSPKNAAEREDSDRLSNQENVAQNQYNCELHHCVDSSRDVTPMIQLNPLVKTQRSYSLPKNVEGNISAENPPKEIEVSYPEVKHSYLKHYNVKSFFTPSKSKKPDPAIGIRYSPNKHTVFSEENTLSYPPGEDNVDSYDFWDAPGRVSFGKNVSNMSPRRRSKRYQLAKSVKLQKLAPKLIFVGWILIGVGLVLTIGGIGTLFYLLSE